MTDTSMSASDVAVEVEVIGAANHDCLAKRRDGEPMFILLGRDPDAHRIVRLWAQRRLEAGGDPDHCNPVLALADTMEAYASDPANRPASAPVASAYPALTTSDETARLREALEGIRDHANVCIQDGREIAATIWRLALEDIVRDVATALQSQEPK